MATKAPPLYSASLTAGGLMLAETRALATVLAAIGPNDRETWDLALMDGNILQKRSPSTALRQGRLIRQRLLTLCPDGWGLLADGDGDTLRSLSLAAALAESRLLHDYMHEVVVDRWRSFHRDLKPGQWESFWADVVARQPSLSSLQEVTQRKIATVVLRILREAGIVTAGGQLNFLPLPAPCIAYLERPPYRHLLSLLDPHYE